MPSALEVLVEIIKHGDSEAARVGAADKILDRALGKAPQHTDINGVASHRDRLPIGARNSRSLGSVRCATGLARLHTTR
jgi:hypothetical protein